MMSSAWHERSCYWKRKMKHGPRTNLTGHSDLATVQLDNRLGDRKTHAGTLDQHSLIAATIEFFKNHFLLHGIDARTAVSHTGYNFGALQFCYDLNWSLRGRVFRGVIQELRNHLTNAFEIHAHWRKILWDCHFQGAVAQDRLRS